MKVDDFLVTKDLIARITLVGHPISLVVIVHFFVNHSYLFIILRFEYDKLLFTLVCITFTINRKQWVCLCDQAPTFTFLSLFDYLVSVLLLAIPLALLLIILKHLNNLTLWIP